ncbi:MAG: flagellar basal body rod protein FlgB [Proteobacteria bacterium]|nr:flagellar basal body rod protein FlgB [Pseudomonadota bacterium]NBX86403.1 flagellar basal body rod protein FlgB [Pseudomonadota bacterium]
MASVSDALSARMNYLIARQGMIASNIANADTPEYLPKDLVARAGGSARSNFGMAVSNAMHMAGGSGAKLKSLGSVVEDQRFVQHNGNGVRIDQEMLKMNETQLNYRLMTELYSKQVNLQRIAMGRGR